LQNIKFQNLEALTLLAPADVRYNSAGSTPRRDQRRSEM